MTPGEVRRGRGDLLMTTSYGAFASATTAGILRDFGYIGWTYMAVAFGVGLAFMFVFAAWMDWR